MSNSPSELRWRNRTNLLRHLHLHGPATRATLTTHLRLNRSTIKALVDELATDGLVVERLPDGRERPGRPSPLVIPQPDALVVLSVDIRVDEVVVGLMGINGRVFTRRRWDLRSGWPVEHVLVDIAEYARLLIGESTRPICGVGVAVPGIVRLDDGIVHDAPNLHWNDVALREWFENELRLPVDLGNDAELGALAESTRGVARGAHDVAYVFVDVGVGGGVISRGASLLGTRSHVGEFGHMVVRTGGRECYCGCEGCWETEIGRAALARALNLPENCGREEVAAGMRALLQEPVAVRRALGEVAEWLAVGVCNLVNLLGSDLVVLGGLLAELPAEVVALVEETVQRRSIVSRAVCGVRVEQSSLGQDGPLVGAAEMAFQRALSAPRAAFAGTKRRNPAASLHVESSPVRSR
ncbi:putative NBD/HSP70 family sugar kinase [Saccharothrix coeruleofusca]|uniref:ROK family protein n=1 Tax=Saccharothrix coeruleofusca TaxID=33919 RepID=UPI001AE37092|nr:ROK family protein [Saccharothrix coeruleofusca]MBP2334878.1 putative NBD/HSP70 family sugar kinase [Saccharothrix coeruleofusca]